MADRESFANKLGQSIYDIKNFAQSILISERPPALQAASQTSKIGKTGIQPTKIPSIF